MKPKKPFMIEGGPTGNDLLRITPKGAKWVAWEGSQYATREEAEAAIKSRNILHPATVIEVLDQVRLRS